MSMKEIVGKTYVKFENVGDTVQGTFRGFSETFDTNGKAQKNAIIETSSGVQLCGYAVPVMKLAGVNKGSLVKIVRKPSQVSKKSGRTFFDFAVFAEEQDADGAAEAAARWEESHDNEDMGRGRQ